MHFELAKEKQISVKVPLILLVVWIIGSSWYWVCGVKGVCSDGSVLTETSTKDK